MEASLILLDLVYSAVISRSCSYGYQVLSPRSYRLIVTIILESHPGSSGALDDSAARMVIIGPV